MGSRFGVEADEAEGWDLAADVPNSVGVLIATGTALKISTILGGGEQLDLVNPGFQVALLATVAPCTGHRRQTGG